MMQGIVWMLGTLMEVVLLLSLQRGTNRSLRTSRSDPPPGSGGCFNCGIDGHQARDCKPGDWKNKCYRCEERDHIEQNWKNSPRKLKRGGSYSQSPIRSHSPRHGRSQSRSYS